MSDENTSLKPAQMLEGLEFDAFMKEMSNSDALKGFLQPIAEMFNVKELSEKLDKVIRNQMKISEGINILLNR